MSEMKEAKEAVELQPTHPSANHDVERQTEIEGALKTEAASESSADGTREPQLSEKAAAPSTPASSANGKRSKPPILCLGMARTGTASLGKALNILGIDKVHHGLEMGSESFEYQWRIFNRAADCVFPTIASYTGEPFGRADWDECFGDYNAVTDLASFFAMSLIQSYPDARVILVERDIDHWLESIKVVFEPWEKPSYRRANRIVERYSGTIAGSACGKMFEGWTRCERPEDLMKDARASYLRHYSEIRAAVPPEQLLNFNLADGWEPLCKFLGKEVPDMPFPRVNDKAAYNKHRSSEKKRVLKNAARNFCLPCV